MDKKDKEIIINTIGGYSFISFQLPYLLGETEQIPKQSFFFSEDFFKDYMSALPFEPDSEIFIKAYKICRENYDPWAAIKYINLKISDYQKKYETLVKSGWPEMEAVLDILQIDESKKSINEGIKYLFPEFKEDIKPYFEKMEYEKHHYLFAKLVLTYDRDYYLPFLKNFLKNNYLHQDGNMFLHLLDDIEFVKEITFDRVERFLSYDRSFDNGKVLEKIKNYFETGEMDESFKKELKSYKIFGPNSFGSRFLSRLKLKIENPFIFNLFKFSSFVDPMGFLNSITGGYYLKDWSKIVERLSFPIEDIGDWCCYREGYLNDARDVIRYYTKNSLKLFMKGVNSSKQKGSVECKIIIIETVWGSKKGDKDSFLPYMLQFTSDRSKQVRDKVFRYLKSEKKYIEKFRELLKSKKQDSRLIGVNLLIHFKLKEDKELLKKHYQSEKGSKVKKVIEKYLGDYLYKDNKKDNKKMVKKDKNGKKDHFDKNFVIKISEKYIPKGKKEPLAGVKKLDIRSLPKLYWKDKKEVEIEVVYYLFSISSREKFGKIYKEIDQIIELMDEKYFTPFLDEVYNRYNFDNKMKWIWGFFAQFDYIKPLDSVYENIKYCSKNGKTVSAKGYIDMINPYRLGTEGSFILYKIGREERRSKIREHAIHTLFKNSDINIENIIDNIILEKIDKLKKSKNKKELNKVKKYQLERIKDQLLYPRDYKFNDWKRFFIKNKEMNKLGRDLIWGIYKDKKYIKGFHLLDDLTLVDIDDNGIKIDENDIISLVHPVDILDDEKTKWIEHIEDYELKPPFDQIGRKIYPVKKEEFDDKLSTIFRGYVIDGNQLKREMKKNVWETGGVYDNGIFYGFYKSVNFKKLAELEISGGYIGSEYSEDIAIKGVKILDVETSYRVCEIDEVPERVFSELNRELERILKKGEYKENWEDYY